MLGRNTAYLHHPRPSSSSAIDLDGVEVLLHHHQYLHQHHQQQAAEASFPGLYLASNAAAPPLEGSAFFSQENGGEPPKPAKKATTKKDRHSKIHTAQGPRDRRVRLSIGIARKFFDLQETLGVDKPSKTLDWLLTKSKTAIKELVQKKQSSSSSPSACELHSPAADDVENGGESKRKAAKESRAKARARARERTLEKMCFKQLGSDLNPSFHCRNNNQQLEFLQLSAGGSSSSNNVPIYHSSLSNQNLIQESAAIKRKNKNPPPSSSSSSILGFQQNHHHHHLVFSTDLNANYMIPSANSAHENWDCFGLNPQSNLHAVFDQHKFFNW